MDWAGECDDVRLFESPHMISVLLFLSDNNGCKKTDLYEGLGRSSRIPVKLDTLLATGLIRMESKGNTTRIYFTDDGRKVADYLVGVKMIIERARHKTHPDLQRPEE